MTATDELRRLLDGRGVEWVAIGTDTCWTGADGYPMGAWETTNGTHMRVADLTPEQAIEATLGRGTCRDLAETPEYRDKTEFKCSECGYEYSAVGGFGCDCGDTPDFRFCPNCGRKVVDA